jgi:hypothetical protein
VADKDMLWIIEGLVPRMIKEDYYDTVYMGMKVHYNNVLDWGPPPIDYDPKDKRKKLPWTKMPELTGIYLGSSTKI